MIQPIPAFECPKVPLNRQQLLRLRPVKFYVNCPERYERREELIYYRSNVRYLQKVKALFTKYNCIQAFFILEDILQSEIKTVLALEYESSVSCEKGRI